MADIRLVKPQANTAQTVSCAADSRFVLEFPSDAALFARDGDDLVLTFEDGSSIRLQDFYTTYSKEEMPSFEMEGAEISGEDFFAALGNPDLMPAAGPTAAAAQGNSSFNVYGDAALLGGIDRLDGLDISFNFGQQTQDALYASIGRDDGEGVVDHGVTVRPTEPGGETPNIPVIDNPDNPNDNPFAGVSAERDVLLVREDALANGTSEDKSAVSANGSMEIDAADGVASIVIGNVTVYENGALTNRPVTTDEGQLVVKGFDAASGRLEYTYTLTGSTQEHTGEGNEAIAHELGVTVTDSDGSTGNGVIKVVIKDDAPQFATVEQIELGGDNGPAGSLSGTFELNYGADGTADTGELTVVGGTLQSGDATSGTYVFAVEGGTLTITRGENNSYNYEFAASNPNATFEHKFTVVAKDSDDDTANVELTVSQNYDAEILPGGTTPGAEDNTIRVDEGSQPEHGDSETHASTGTGSFIVDLHGEDGTITVGGWKIQIVEGEAQPATGTAQTVHGVSLSNVSATLVDGKWTVSYEYALSGAQKHGEADSATDATLTGTLPITVTDADGVQVSGSIHVEVHDDVPTLTVKEFTGAYGEGISGTVNFSFGADDGEGAKIELSVNKGDKVAGVLGADGKTWTFNMGDGQTVTLNAETGDFYYDLPASGSKDSYKFEFTVTDADSDENTATATVEIAPKASYTGTVSSSDNDLLQTISPSHPVDVSSMPDVQHINGGTDIVKLEDGTVIGKFSCVNGKLFFQQYGAYSHDKGSDAVPLSHQLNVTDEFGEEHIVAVDITIEDSNPYAHNDTFELKERGEGDAYDAEGNVLENDTKSADSPTLVTEVDGQTIADGDSFTEITGDLGTLYIRADGTYHYVLDEGVTIPENSIMREEFTYTITDADGDTSTAAALTILVGNGTLHVKESGIGVNENGQEVSIDGIKTDTGYVEGVVTSVEFGSTQYSGYIPDKYALKYESTEREDGKIIIHTNYGDLIVEAEGEYRFELDDDAANPLPEGFEIHQGFNFTTMVEGVTTPQEVVVVIEGTNDEGRLTEAGEGGHSGGNLWIDAKAEGADSVELPYDAKNHPNLGDTDSGDHGSDLNQNTNGTARPTAWLPFTLADPDFGDSLTFKAVYTGTNNSASGTNSMEGSEFVSYVELLEGMASNSLSVALSVEWDKFLQNFDAEKLGRMQFYRNEYGIFAITSDAVDLEDLTNQDGAQYWLTFLADSDADVFRQMAEGTSNGASNGKILHFSFQVRDKTGNTVKTSAGDGEYVDVNNVLVHVYGSNDTPEIALSDGRLHVHDDDVSYYNNDGYSGDKESHTITVEYGGKTYTGMLTNGQVTLTNYSAANDSITCTVEPGGGVGTNFTISGFKDSYGISIDGQFVITITDMRYNTATYHVVAQDGTLTEVTCSIEQLGTVDSDNLYGGWGNDNLFGGDGNDSLWGGAGNDTLNGGSGNDRLYGEAGNDMLWGEDGKDILVGGDGNDSLYGGADNDVLIGDGQGDLQSAIEDTVNAETFRDFLDLKSSEELEGYIGRFEKEDDGNDQLYGRTGDDLLFGMGGNDYLDGGEGEDTIFGGSGNDIIVYDQSDYMVIGGSGIDFMVSDTPMTIDDLLAGGQDKPIVDGIEVLITGNDATSLTNISQLANKYGITLDKNDKGEDTLILDMTQWQKDTDDNTYTYIGKENVNLTLQTTLKADPQSDQDAVQQQVFILQNQNG